MTRGAPIQPPLTTSDAWLLAALTEGSHDGRPVTLRKFVHDADWLNRAIPTFDEVSFGLPRLVAAGFLTVECSPKDGLTLSATPKAIGLRRSVKTDRRLGSAIIEMENAVQASSYPHVEDEDRSLGRLSGLEPAMWDAALRAHGSWMDRWSRPAVAVGRALTWWQNRRRP